MEKRVTTSGEYQEKGNIEILKEVMAEMVPKLMKLKRFRKFI